MPNLSKDEFVEGLKKSEVVSEEQVTALLQESVSESASEFAIELVKSDHLTRWQAKYLLSGRSVLHIGSYRLLERIRRDELGDRFRAIHTSLGRNVEIQMLPSSLDTQSDECQAFLSKATEVAALDHPNLVHLYDIDQEGGRYYLVNESVDGRNLTELSKSELGPALVGRLLIGVTRGLRHAHAKGVVHGTLSPQDIFVTNTNDIKLDHFAESLLRKSAVVKEKSELQTDDWKKASKFGRALIHNLEDVENQSLNRIVDLMSGLVNQESISTDIDEELDNLEQQFLKTETLSDTFDPLLSAGTLETPPGNVVPKIAKRKKKKPTEPELEAEGLEEPETVGAVAAMWNANPVAVVATAVILILMLAGGIGYLVFGNRGTANNVANNSSKTNPNPKGTKADSDTDASEKNGDASAPKDRQSLVGTNSSLDAEKLASQLDQLVGVDQAVAGNLGGNPKSQSASPSNTRPTDSKPSEPKNDDLKSGNENSFSGGGEFKAPVISEIPSLPVQEKLSLLSGIGGQTEKVLYESGITTFRQLGETKVSRLRQLLDPKRFRSADLASLKRWVGEARQRAGLPELTPEQMTESVGSLAQMDSESGATSDSSNFNPSDSAAITRKKPATPETMLSGMGREFELPSLENVQQVKLASLVIPKTFLLSTELQQVPTIAKARMEFALTRGDKFNQTNTIEEKQKWYVGVGRTADKTEPVAIFQKTSDSVMFQWLPEAAKNRSAPFLRNCFLKFSLPNKQQTFVALRKPMRVPDLRMEKDGLGRKIEFEIPALPKMEVVSVKIRRMFVKETETRVLQPAVSKNVPAVMLLKREDARGFFRIVVSGDIRNGKVRLQSNLVFDKPSLGIQKQPVTSMEMIAGLKNQLSQQRNFRVAAWDQVKRNYKPEFKVEKEKIEKLKDEAEASLALIQQYENIMLKLIDQPIQFQVTAKLGDVELVLAESDPSIPLSSEKKKK